MNTDKYIKTETDLITRNLISVWIDLLDARSLESKEHAHRVSTMAAKFAERLGLDYEVQKQIYFGSLLHDIGKLGLKDSILQKKDTLTEDEYADVKQHAIIARQMIEDSPYLSSFKEIPYYHHERWDGQGYPEGKKGEDIPFNARLYAIIDTWDALTNDRPFRKAYARNKAIETIKEGKGTQFDPQLVESFIAMIEEREVSEDGKPIILVVDDEPYLRLALSDLFDREGFDCRVASSSKEALEILEAVTPSLIISDIMMPTMNGFDFKRSLQVISNELAEIPFIFLSAKTAKQDILEGYELKIDDYMTKPFEPMELLAKVKAILRRSDLVKKQEELTYTREINNLAQVITRNTTHELKSPLGIIIGNLEVIMRKFQTIEDPVIGKCLTDAQTSAIRLQGVIDQLLYLYKVDNSILADVVEPIDIQNDLVATLKTTIASWPAKNLHLHLDVDDRVHISVPYNGFIYSVAQLVDNACKFADNDGNIQVELHNDNGSALLSIENDGIKIPKSMREKVFERFFQISNGDTRETGGLGLGLAIVKNFVTSCNGSVEFIDSKIGTKICLRIPMDNRPVLHDHKDIPVAVI